MTELKPTSKRVLSDAVQMLEDLGAPELTELQACLLLATAALKAAEALDDDTVDDDKRKDVKRARKLIQSLLPAPEVNVAAEEKGLDLGQYSHTKVFDGNSKKIEKFARLMGGAASPQPHHHNTFAPDSKTTQRITHEIQEQFDMALQHKGKKGLGL